MKRATLKYYDNFKQLNFSNMEKWYDVDVHDGETNYFIINVWRNKDKNYYIIEVEHIDDVGDIEKCEIEIKFSKQVDISIYSDKSINMWNVLYSTDIIYNNITIMFLNFKVITLKMNA